VSVIVQGASAVVVGGAALADPVNATPAGQAACWTVVALLLLGLLAVRRVPAARLDARGGLLAIPLLGAVAVNLTNLVTGDYSAAAQVFLVMPVLLAAAKFRSATAALVTAVAVGGDVAVTLTLAELSRALTDSLFVGSALITVTVVLVSSQDRREALLRTLEQQASVDGVTGLRTRRVFDDAVAGAVRSAVPGSGAGTALVLVDVDHFKEVNDEHGHPVGDAALGHLAAVLSATVRRTDAVVGRMGGDELAVLLPGCTAEVAADLLAAVRVAPLELPDGSLLALSVSVGVAHLDGVDGSPRELYVAADQALYQAKRAGRDQLAVAGA